MIQESDNSVVERTLSDARMTPEFFENLGYSVNVIYNPISNPNEKSILLVAVKYDKVDWDISWIHVAISNGDPTLLGQGVSFKTDRFTVYGTTYRYDSMIESYWIKIVSIQEK